MKLTINQFEVLTSIERNEKKCLKESCQKKLICP